MASPETPKASNPFGPAAAEFMKAEQDLWNALEEGNVVKVSDAIARGDAAEIGMEEENLKHFNSRISAAEIVASQAPAQSSEQKLQI